VSAVGGYNDSVVLIVSSMAGQRPAPRAISLNGRPESCPTTSMAARYFALVPAAGRSSRMGEPKLLLPVEGAPLIALTLASWQRSRVDRIVVVVRPDDEELAAAVNRSKAQGPRSKIEVTVPQLAPPDMKASVQAALRHIEREYRPTEADAFLVAPPDMPHLSSAMIDRLIELHAAGATADIAVPAIGGRRGHPVLFAWPLAYDVYALAADDGLNVLFDRHEPTLIACEDLIANGEYTFADIDTREEYEGLRGRASDRFGGSLN